ncbi:MAG: hypothetical protein NXI01_09645 [Gammaproteobacteria bacterium]|nr:hypothetical protein [Gammaproteobacteria bacterium]
MMVALPWLYPGVLAGLIMASLFSIYLLAVAMLFQLYKPIPTPTRMFLGFAAIATAYYANLTISPFLFLTLASTPYFFPMIAATTFFFALFETLVRRHPELGNKYSLVKLLLNTRAQYFWLASERTLHINDINLRDLDFLNSWRAMTNRRAAEPHNNHGHRQNPNPAAAQSRRTHYTDLALTEKEKKALITKQTLAIQKLPPALKSLYAQIHKTIYTARSRDEAEALGVHFYSNSEDCIVAQKTELFKHYRETLTANQKTQFDKYLETSLTLSHATCPTTLNPVAPGFMVMEKRYEENSQQHTVPGTTCVFDPSPANMPLVFRQIEANSPMLHPQNRQPFFTPEGETTGYRYHSYQEIESHPLSLAVCEAIEAFNRTKPNQRAVISPENQQLNTATTSAHIALHIHAVPRTSQTAQSSADTFDPSKLHDNMTDEELEQALNAMRRN